MKKYLSKIVLLAFVAVGISSCDEEGNLLDPNSDEGVYIQNLVEAQGYLVDMYKKSERAYAQSNGMQMNDTLMVEGAKLYYTDASGVSLTLDYGNGYDDGKGNNYEGKFNMAIASNSSSTQLTLNIPIEVPFKINGKSISGDIMYTDISLASTTLVPQIAGIMRVKPDAENTYILNLTNNIWVNWISGRTTFTDPTDDVMELTQGKLTYYKQGQLEKRIVGEITTSIKSDASCPKKLTQGKLDIELIGSEFQYESASVDFAPSSGEACASFMNVGFVVKGSNPNNPGTSFTYPIP